MEIAFNGNKSTEIKNFNEILRMNTPDGNIIRELIVTIDDSKPVMEFSTLLGIPITSTVIKHDNEILLDDPGTYSRVDMISRGLMIEQSKSIPVITIVLRD